MKGLVASSLFLLATLSTFASPQPEIVRVGDTYTVQGNIDGIVKPLVSDLTKKPVINLLDGDLFTVVLSLGSPNSYTYFVDMSTGRVDGPFFLFQKISLKDSKIVYVADTGRLASKVLFKKDTINTYDLPGASEVAVITNAVTGIDFLQDGAVRIKYYAGPNFEEKEIVLK